MEETAAAPFPGAAAIVRGTCRMLLRTGFCPLTEVVPEPGLRADILALGPKGEVWIVEVKSCLADFRADRKWTGYLPWCDRFFWAVDAGFPQAVLPEGSGVIVADAWDAEVLRPAPDARLAPARRKALTLRVARTGAERLRRLIDPAL